MKKVLKAGHASPASINQTDEELMLDYAKGSEEAFQILYERYSSKVYGFLAGKLKDRSLTDDAFQATFMKLHRSRAQYDPALPFAPWLFTVSRTAMLDTLRARKKSTRLEDLNPVEVENAVAVIPKEAVSVPGLQALPVIQRQALELRYLQDLSFDEIATRLDTSSENSRQLVSRAVKRLRKILQGSDGEE
jgi:RNA polymerase sigma-70 factor (ECF subfamily)